MYQAGAFILHRRATRATVVTMAYLYTQTIDMTPAGDVLPRQVSMGWPARIGLVAALVALAALAASAAAIFLWLASILLPVALIAGAVAYAAFKLQLWRIRAG
jgi:hypothetical protein